MSTDTVFTEENYGLTEDLIRVVSEHVLFTAICVVSTVPLIQSIC